MSKLPIASTLVLENDLQRRSLGRQMTEDVVRNPQGTSSDRGKGICGVDFGSNDGIDAGVQETRTRLARLGQLQPRLNGHLSENLSHVKSTILTLI